MPEDIRRGFMPTDAGEFGPSSAPLLSRAREDIAYLLNRGYDMERSVTFVGNRFQLSARQRMALTRACACDADLHIRRERERREDLAGATILIDGFNVIIPLEIALCGNTLLLCMDGTIRDLAGLHGTYRLIEKTDEAIALIGEELCSLGVAKAVFYLDSPVSNAGRLKQRIIELLSGRGFELEVNLAPNADRCLYQKECVATGDGIILNNCVSWVNLTRMIVDKKFPSYPFVDLSGR